METGKIEILIIEMAGASVKNKLSWRHSISRNAPIGLYCLKATAPERIAVIDVPVAQINDMLSLYAKEPLKAVICRLSEQPDTELVTSLVETLRTTFPNVKLGCNYIDHDFIKCFDFYIKGTGRSCVLRILRGDIFLGECDDIHNDAGRPLEIPLEPLADVGYDTLSEKWIATHGIEIWQPWLGFDEFSTKHFEYPGQEWMCKFLNWIHSSGFDAIHLNPSAYTPEELNRLRNTILQNKMTVSLSFNAKDDICFSEILIPNLKRVWLHYPKAILLDETVEKLKAIRKAGFEACLYVDYTWFQGGYTLSAFRYIDRFIIADDYLWSNADLKKITQRYWGTKSRFFRRLFGLRSASELITFMKSSYALLDAIFLPDSKGDKK